MIHEAHWQLLRQRLLTLSHTRAAYVTRSVTGGLPVTTRGLPQSTLNDQASFQASSALKLPLRSISCTGE